MAETKMIEILTGIQADMQDVKNNQEKTNKNIEGIYKEMTKKFEEFDIKIRERWMSSSPIYGRSSWG